MDDPQDYTIEVYISPVSDATIERLTNEVYRVCHAELAHNFTLSVEPGLWGWDRVRRDLAELWISIRQWLGV